MIKFVMAHCLADDSVSVDKSKALECMGDAFKGDEKEVTLLDINNINEDTLQKFIQNGQIDCLVFSPDTVVTPVGKSIVSSVLSNKDVANNCKIINLYSSQEEQDVKKSAEIGKLLLQENSESRLLHFDVNTDRVLFAQNLQGIRNDSVKSREKYQQLENDILDFTRSVVQNIETNKDEYTAKHIRSVSKIAEVIAQKRGISPEEIDILKIGALLHDIGKTDIADSVLKKPSRLTDEEFKEMRSHVTLGEIELNNYNLGDFERAKIIASEHHERYDGKGYPRGLKGDEIDELSRIVSLADSTQAMFGRSYQSGKKKDELISELKRCAGSQFDPKMVDTLCDVLDKEPELVYVSYDENENIIYDVPDTDKLLEDTMLSRNKREQDFFDSLKENTNPDLSEDEKNMDTSNSKDKEIGKDNKTIE